MRPFWGLQRDGGNAFWGPWLECSCTFLLGAVPAMGPGAAGGWELWGRSSTWALGGVMGTTCLTWGGKEPWCSQRGLVGRGCCSRGGFWLWEPELWERGCFCIYLWIQSGSCLLCLWQSWKVIEILAGALRQCVFEGQGLFWTPPQKPTLEL